MNSTPQRTTSDDNGRSLHHNPFGQAIFDYPSTDSLPCDVHSLPSNSNSGGGESIPDGGGFELRRSYDEYH